MVVTKIVICYDFGHDKSINTRAESQRWITAIARTILIVEIEATPVNSESISVLGYITELNIKHYNPV